MNARQAARAAAKHIEDLEHYNAMCKRDIVAYNRIIEGLIAGNLNPCDWCDEQPDCAPSNQGKGCKEWCLKFDLPEEKKGDEEQDDGKGTGAESEGISVTGSEGRA